MAVVLFLVAVFTPLQAHATAFGRRDDAPACAPSQMPFLTIWDQGCRAASRSTAQTSSARAPGCKKGQKSTAAKPCRSSRGPNAR
jgi:hypothetical protein